MKKIWLIAFLILKWTCKIYALDQFSLDNFVFSEKLSLDFFSFRAVQQGDNQSYNIGIFINPTSKLRMTFKTGNYSYSESFSKLSSPALSTPVSPFYNASPTLECIKPINASSTSFSSPWSYFAQIYYSPNKRQKFYLNGFYVPEKESCGISFKAILSKTKNNKSLITGILKKESMDCGISFTGAIFPIDEYKEDAWFLKKNYYPKDFAQAVSIEGVYNNSVFSSALYFNMYNSPFNNFRFNVLSLNSFHLGKNLLSLSFFYNQENDYLTPSKKSVLEQVQIKGGINFEPIKFKTIKMSNGFTFLANIDLYNKTHNIFFNAGTKINKSVFFTQLYLNCKGDFQVSSQDFILKNISLYNKNTFYLNKFNLKINETVNFEPDFQKNKIKTSEKISLGLSNSGNTSFSLSANFELSQENWSFKDYDFSFSASITIKPPVFGKPQLSASYSQN